MDANALRAVFGALRETPHSPNKQAKNTPWVGLPLVNLGGRAEREAVKIVAAWIENGVLVKGSYYHTGSRHDVQCVTLDDAKAGAILASIEVADAPAE